MTPETSEHLSAEHPNHDCALDFQFDQLAGQRRLTHALRHRDFRFRVRVAVFVVAIKASIISSIMRARTGSSSIRE